MIWGKKETAYIKENYPKNIRVEDIAKELKTTVKSVRQKAVKLNLSRHRFSSPEDRLPRKITDRKYYEQNKEKVYERKINRRWRLKAELISLLGGKCDICGYNKSQAAMDFHHTKDKDCSIAILIKNSSRQKLLKEVKKCILLCANCHRELHYKGL